MKYSVLRLAPLSFVFAAWGIAGCNTAPLAIPPYDAAADCPLAPDFVGCDGGANGEPTCGELVDAAIPPGAYPVQCIVRTHPLQTCSNEVICNCATHDAGTSFWVCQTSM
ncbi:MAG TPA: hypothetical protein VGI39_45125 [Polyangiaceae bacterium]|jgi:hypothetical protein